MKCECQIIEKENNVWVVAVSKCIEGYNCFGPFESKYEVEGYIKQYLEPYIASIRYYDFEHPDTRALLNKIDGPAFKSKYWDFEDFKILAWRNAGFRSRK
jgi:hypothetical protein